MKPENTLNDMQFSDKNGHLWDVSLTYRDAERIDKSDFTELTEQPFCFVTGPASDKQEEVDAFLHAIQKPSLCVAIIWVVVLPQVKDQLGIDPDDEYENARDEFLSGFDGTTVALAKEAFWRAVCDFFPEQRTLLENIRTRLTKATELMNRKVQEMEIPMERMIDEELEKATAHLTNGAS